MKKRYLRTSEVAQATGVHPNTVRLYESWGFLPTIPRGPSGYRLFTETHLAQMRLARTALRDPWPGKMIRQAALALVRQAAAGDLGGALEKAYSHRALIRAERAQANAAVDFLERWAQGIPTDATPKSLQIGKAGKLLRVTTDTLRNWERNGLIKVPRNLHNRYRLYGAREIGRLRVIRMLRNAGYSLMAILRMLIQFDRGNADDLRGALDTPSPDQDVYSAADRWLSTLSALEQRAVDVIAQLEQMISDPPA